MCMLQCREGFEVMVITMMIAICIFSLFYKNNALLILIKIKITWFSLLKRKLGDF